MIIEFLKRHKKCFSLGFALFVVLGIVLRFYRITALDFVFYDEGYYLNFNRYFYEKLSGHFPPNNWFDFKMSMWMWLKLSLATGKAFWFMLSDARVFFGGLYAWYFPRILSAISGTATLALVYLFAKRFYESRKIALLSVLLMAVSPSHVFYSRLGMQETFSTMCFMMAFYFYIFPRKMSSRAFLAGFLFSAAYFTNYRLITSPVHLACCELFLSLHEKRLPDIRKYVWTVVAYFFFVFMIGNIDQGNNTVIVFAWIFYQSNIAKGKFDFLNFLSFPYYLFRLENFFFGLLFFANVNLVFLKEWKRLLPFAIVCVHMLIYSFAGEQGARYLCVVSPFAIMSVAALIVYILEKKKNIIVQTVTAGLVCVMLIAFGFKSVRIARSHTDFQNVMEYLAEIDPDFKIIATQNFVLNLFVKDRSRVVACPYKFGKLLKLYRQGYKYLVVDPQAYVSFVPELDRFNPELYDFLEFIVSKFTPIKTFDHFNDILLERFVLDHNENLRKSLAFLNANKESYSQIRVYDLVQVFTMIDRVVGIDNIRLNPDYVPSRPSDALGR